jgi:uncharacterized damage-inducible protein DinB
MKSMVKRGARPPAGDAGGSVGERLVAVWRRHNDILLFLLNAVPPRGLAALPADSRGRDVSRVFAHLDRVRRAWVHYFMTGERASLPRHNIGAGPGKPELRRALAGSGQAIERFLAAALEGEAHVRYFGRDPVRWLGYLIAHESHHRGQIMLALKQSGFKIPESVAIQGLWGKWIMGK